MAKSKTENQFPAFSLQFSVVYRVGAGKQIASPRFRRLAIQSAASLDLISACFPAAVVPDAVAELAGSAVAAPAGAAAASCGTCSRRPATELRFFAAPAALALPVDATSLV
jgi:hypothetical protein